MGAGIRRRPIEAPEAGGNIVAIARAFMARQDPDASQEATAGRVPARGDSPTVVVDVARPDAEKAGGTKSDILNAKLIREACLGLDERGAREVIELLKELAPRDVREALTIRRLVMLDALMVETVALARAAGHPLLRDAYAAQACALSHAATHLDEALERKRSGKPERRIVVQHIRGGQAIGMVNQELTPR
jgi:hypothetical protein